MDHPDGTPPSPTIHHTALPLPGGLTLECGVHLDPVTVAYRTYGTLAPDRSNAILVCHALTGDQYVAESHPVTGKSGWWDRLVGPGLSIDTDRFFIICANVLGGCMGTTGPATPFTTPDSQMLRIGRHAIVSFPNFGHWQLRWQLLTTGRMPMTETWGRPWYETPNIHPCTISDFFALAEAEGCIVEQWMAVDEAGDGYHVRPFGGVVGRCRR